MGSVLDGRLLFLLNRPRFGLTFLLLEIGLVMMNSDSASFPFLDLESALKLLAVICLDLRTVLLLLALFLHVCGLDSIMDVVVVVMCWPEKWSCVVGGFEDVGMMRSIWESIEERFMSLLDVVDEDDCVVLEKKMATVRDDSSSFFVFDFKIFVVFDGLNLKMNDRKKMG